MTTTLPHSYFSDGRSPFPEKKIKESRSDRFRDVYIPRHIAVIMDGNRRYAGKHGIAAGAGHRMGTKTTSRIIEWAYRAGVSCLTVYAFSTENFNRKDEEIRTIFSLLTEKLDQLIRDEKIMKRGLCVRVIGDLSLLPEGIVGTIREIEEKTKDNDRMFVNIALAYGGRQDLVSAFRKMSEASAEMNDPGKDLREEIRKNLWPSPECGNPVPDVDLVIRTGGELRTSNFLSWQANGNRAVFYVSEKMWPEFGLLDFKRAIMAYSVAGRAGKKHDEKRKRFIREFLENEQKKQSG